MLNARQQELIVNLGMSDDVKDYIIRTFGDDSVLQHVLDHCPSALRDVLLSKLCGQRERTAIVYLSIDQLSQRPVG